jgi:hypothetical protein
LVDIAQGRIQKAIVTRITAGLEGNHPFENHSFRILLQDFQVMKRILLICGILSSLLYVIMNIFVPLGFEGYSYAAHTVSELSAIGAPTRTLWVAFAMIWALLFAAFGWGVLKSATENRPLRVVGVLILVYCAVNFYWPPMHSRKALAAGEGSLTDTLHLVWAGFAVLFMLLMMGFGAAAFGRIFRIYTIASMALHFLFGFLTSLEAPNVETNVPTPWIGVWERINIGIFLLWVAVLAVMLLRREREDVY